MATLDHNWRLEHADAGDMALFKAEAMMKEAVESKPNDYVIMNLAAIGQTYAAIAQAHYSAANIRAKPQTPNPGCCEPGAPSGTRTSDSV